MQFFVFQAISTTVANALESFYGQEVQGTVKFIRMFDKFFDCLNSRSLTEADRNRKPNMAPYKSPHDQRLKVLIVTIIEVQYFSNDILK